MSTYKLPSCWIGYPRSRVAAEQGVLQPLGTHTEKTEVITENDCNPDCHCPTIQQALFCMEGHITECHAGMACSEAKCNHYALEEQEADDWDTQRWYGEGSSG